MHPATQKALAILPAAVLVAVAGWQSIRVQTHDQSPWIGAGFSMFAYVDGGQYRPLIVVEVDDPAVSVSIPARLHREADRLKAAPTDDRATRFAQSIAAEAGRDVRVEVWRPLFDAESLVLSAELIASGSSR